MRTRHAPVSLVASNLVSSLVARRHVMGLTQADVAGMIGVGRTEVGAWEQRRRSPTLGSLLRWARALDLHVRLLPFDGRKRRAGNIHAILPLISPETRRRYSSNPAGAG